MKKAFIVCSLALFLAACGGNSGADQNAAATENNTEASGDSESGNPPYDPHRGEGKFNAENVNIGSTLDKAMADQGQKIAEMKCESCHKMTDERLVGPGWKDVTKRHSPEWIMNFMTNTDAMLDKDPKAQAMLEICMVRMPNQNLTDQDARDILEYMRENDGVK